MIVLDASAVLAVVLLEAGADKVLPYLPNAHLSAVNLSEAMCKLIEYRMTPEDAARQIGRLNLEVHPFGPGLAAATAILRTATKPFGLSLGDRACLALARELGLPVLTSDGRMAETSKVVALDIRLIR